jgi:putative hydrolase of the HAD superfamily
VDIRALAFDINGTLIEIWTEDGAEAAFRAVGHFLTYQGIDVRRGLLRDLYFQVMKEQLRASPETHPEVDAPAVWARIIDTLATDFTRSLAPDARAQLPVSVAQVYRGVTRRRLHLYPHVREVLDALRGRLPMAVVTDAQSAYARGEMHKVGLLDYFSPIVVSGDYGYRKPDRRLFQAALDGLGVAAEHTLYVGNDMHRDVYGAREAGMRTVMFNSDQGTKAYGDCVPDYTIDDHRELLRIVDLAR